MKSVKLNFFGTEILVSSDNELLIDRINYIFKYFLSNGEPQLFFKVSIEKKDYADSRILDDGLLTNGIANISYSYDNIKYYPWNFSDTFLPPLQIPPLAGRFLVLHGCAIRVMNMTVAFIAPSLGGKTTLVYHSIKNGALCITDDLIFIEDGYIIPYKKPVGIRESNHIALADLINKKHISPLTLINPKGNATYLTHLNDVFNSPYIEYRTKIDWFVVPDKDQFGNPRILNMFDLAQILSTSICNSGLHDKNMMKALFLAINSIKGAFFLPTADIETAYRNLLSFVAEEK